VVVPLPDLRDFGAEALHVRVVTVVQVIAPVLLQRLGDFQLLRHLVQERVGPQQLAGRLVDDALGQRAVCIDRVAGMNEEVRPCTPHRLVNLHAPEAEIDAPTLTAGVAGPDEADIAPLFGWRAKVADDRFAARLARIEIFESHTHEHVTLGRQVGEIEASSHVGDIQSVRTAQRDGIRKTLIARPFDEHARGFVGAAPDDGAIADDVADLQAPRRHWAQRVGSDHSGCLSRVKDAANAGQCDTASEGLFEELTTVGGRTSRASHRIFLIECTADVSASVATRAVTCVKSR
jgi:hypothetical protein